jgi:hypothetical protein
LKTGFPRIGLPVSPLGERFVQVLHKPLEAKINQEAKPPPPFIRPPLVQIAQPPDAAVGAIAVT